MACAQGAAMLLNPSRGMISRGAAVPSNCRLRTPAAFVAPATASSILRRAMAMATAQDKGSCSDRALQVQTQPPPPQPQSLTTRQLLDYWDPFALTTRSMRQMLETMDRLFTKPSFFEPSRLSIRMPWDIVEDEEHFYLRLDIPGFDKEEVKVQLDDNVLVVKAEHKVEEKEQDKWERSSCGSYNTRIGLPNNVETTKLKAKLSNGVLEVEIPKVKKDKNIVDVKIE